MTQEKYLSHVRMDPHRGGKSRPGSWGRKDEEYIADFCLVARRTLTADEYKLFRYHFLLGADWKLCSKKLDLDRGNFFHAVYRIEQKLGRTFRELEPYPLFPLDDYFHGPSRLEPRRSAVSGLAPVVPMKRRLPFPPVGRTA